MTLEEWNNLKVGQVIYRYDKPVKILKINSNCITLEPKRKSKYNRDGTVYCRNDKYMFFLQPMVKNIVPKTKKIGACRGHNSCLDKYKPKKKSCYRCFQNALEKAINEVFDKYIEMLE